MRLLPEDVQMFYQALRLLVKGNGHVMLTSNSRKAFERDDLSTSTKQKTSEK